MNLPRLHVKTLGGHTSDNIGRTVWGGAEIVLLDPAQSQVPHVSTDSSGNF